MEDENVDEEKLKRARKMIALIGEHSLPETEIVDFERKYEAAARRVKERAERESIEVYFEEE